MAEISVTLLLSPTSTAASSLSALPADAAVAVEHTNSTIWFASTHFTWELRPMWHTARLLCAARRAANSGAPPPSSSSMTVFAADDMPLKHFIEETSAGAHIESAVFSAPVDAILRRCEVAADRGSIRLRFRVDAAFSHVHSDDSPPDINRLHFTQPALVWLEGDDGANEKHNPTTETSDAAGGSGAAGPPGRRPPHDAARRVMREHWNAVRSQVTNAAAITQDRYGLLVASPASFYVPVPDRAMAFNFLGVMCFVVLAVYLAVFGLTVRRNVGDDWTDDESEWEDDN